MLNRFLGTKLHNSISMCKSTQLLRTAQAGFAARNKEGVVLNAKWLAMASKETKGKVNILDKLVRETNE